MASSHQRNNYKSKERKGRVWVPRVLQPQQSEQKNDFKSNDAESTDNARLQLVSSSNSPPSANFLPDAGSDALVGNYQPPFQPQYDEEEDSKEPETTSSSNCLPSDASSFVPYSPPLLLTSPPSLVPLSPKTGADLIPRPFVNPLPSAILPPVLSDSISKAVPTVEALIADIKANSVNPLTIVLYYGMLCNFAQKDDSLKRKIVQSNGIQLVASGMRKWLHIPAVLDAGCCVLSTLTCYSQENRLLAGRAGIIEIALTGSRKYRDNPHLQNVILNLLSDLTAASENQRIMLQLAGNEWLLDMMKFHLEDASVQGSACRALINLSCDFESRKRAGNNGAIERIVLAFKKHTKNATIFDFGCWALDNLFIQNQTYVKNFVKLDGVKLIIDGMGRFPHDVDCQENAGLVLSTLAKSRYVESISQVRGVEVLVHSLKFHPLHENITNHAYESLFFLIYKNNIGRKKIRELGGIKLVLTSMKTFRDSEEILQKACTLLSSLALEDSNEVEIREAGGIELLLDTMRNHPKAAKIQLESCTCFYNLCATENERSQEILVAAGGIELISSNLTVSMFADSDSEVEQQAQFCCSLLALLSFTRSYALKLRASHLSEFLLNCAKRFPQNLEIQEKCHMALDEMEASAKSSTGRVSKSDRAALIMGAVEIMENLRTVSAEPLNERNLLSYEGLPMICSLPAIVLLLLECDYIGAILTAMTYHPTHLKMHLSSCEAIAKLCSQQKRDVTVQIIKHDGLPILLRSMKTFADHSTIQTHICDALHNLATIEANRSLILTPDCLSQLLATINNHKHIERTLLAALLALANLAADDHNRTLIEVAGGAAVILTAIKIHPKTAEIQRRGFFALSNLADGEICLQMAEAGGIEIIIEGMKAHQQHEHLQEDATQTLLNLSANIISQKERILRAGGIDVLLTSIRSYPQNAMIQRNCFFILSNLCALKETKSKIINTGGIKLIAAAKKLHAQDEGVRQQTERLLKNLRAAPN